MLGESGSEQNVPLLHAARFRPEPSRACVVAPNVELTPCTARESRGRERHTGDGPRGWLKKSPCSFSVTQHAYSMFTDNIVCA